MTDVCALWVFRYKLLNQVPYYEEKRVSYASGRHTFHVMTRQEMIYLCLAQNSTKKKLCYDFLNEVWMLLSVVGWCLDSSSRGSMLQLLRILSPYITYFDGWPPVLLDNRLASDVFPATLW